MLTLPQNHNKRDEDEKKFHRQIAGFLFILWLIIVIVWGIYELIKFVITN